MTDHGRSRHHIVCPNDPELFGAAAPLMMAHEVGQAARLVAGGL